MQSLAGGLEGGQELIEDGDVVQVVRGALDVLMHEGEQLEEQVLPLVDQFQQWAHCLQG